MMSTVDNLMVHLTKGEAYVLLIIWCVCLFTLVYQGLSRHK
jgi:hypothetical protein